MAQMQIYFFSHKCKEIDQKYAHQYNTKLKKKSFSQIVKKMVR